MCTYTHTLGSETKKGICRNKHTDKSKSEKCSCGFPGEVFISNENQCDWRFCKLIHQLGSFLKPVPFKKQHTTKDLFKILLGSRSKDGTGIPSSGRKVWSISSCSLLCKSPVCKCKCVNSEDSLFLVWLFVRVDLWGGGWGGALHS